MSIKITSEILEEVKGLLFDNITLLPGFNTIKKYINYHFNDIPQKIRNDIENSINYLIPAPLHPNNWSNVNPAVKKAAKSSGRIEAKGKIKGTAWMIANNIAITNKHVTGDFFSHGTNRFFASYEGYVFVDFKENVTANDNSFKFVVEKVLLSKYFDIAFLFLKEKNNRGEKLPEPIYLAADNLTSGNEVFAIGNPVKDSNFPFKELLKSMLGEIAGIKRISFGKIKEIGMNDFIHNCTSFEGSSGSCIVDHKGKVVGIHCKRINVLSYEAIPASVVTKTLEEILRPEIKIASSIEKSFDLLSAEKHGSILYRSKSMLDMPYFYLTEKYIHPLTDEYHLTYKPKKDIKEEKMSERFEQLKDELECLSLEVEKIQMEIKKKIAVLEGELHELRLKVEILETKKHMLALEQDISRMEKEISE